MLGDKKVLVLYWTSGDEDNSILGGTCSSKDNFVHGFQRQRRFVDWVQGGFSHSSSSNFTNIPTGSDLLAGLHTWSAGTSGFFSGTDTAACLVSIVGWRASAGTGWDLAPYPQWAWMLGLALER